SDNLGHFSKSATLGLLLNALKTHVEESEGGEVEGDAPLPDVMIDWANDGRLLLPEVPGMDVRKIRPLYRIFIKRKWVALPELKLSAGGKMRIKEFYCSGVP
ncbi:hypothetical protein FRC08_013056, partial [Ceratobasidium sp. 394]